METKSPPAPQTPPRNAMSWAGWVFTVLPCLLLVFSGVMKFVMPPDMAKGLDHLGWDPKLMVPLGIVELSCVVVYLFPRTAVLGAILLTGYLGGATATHARVGDPFYMTIIFGVIIWLGLYLRDARVRALIPWRT
jgi:hypothetical protein